MLMTWFLGGLAASVVQSSTARMVQWGSGCVDCED